ncbi:MAG TPA: rhodanese-like domain-containing protein [Paludibacter sp.]|nr:rhodanese-like domain-containing protein [Paludibacter sp.]
MQKKIIPFVWSILLVIFMLSCTGKEIKKYNNAKEMSDEAKKTVTFVSAENLKAAIDSGEKFYLIDCRETDEFDSACIKGAINIPRGLLESQIAEKAPAHRKTIFIYCSNGNRSTLAATVLPKLKYAHVKVLEGGIDNLKAKFPDLLELNPIRGDVKSKAPAKSSGGCGG